MATFFEYSVFGDGIRIMLKEKKLIGAARIVPLGEWPHKVEAAHMIGAARLLALSDECVDDERPAAVRDETAITLSFSLAASLEEHVALQIGLPCSTGLILGIDCRGGIAQSDFDLNARWLSGGAIPALGVSVQGSILSHAGKKWRIPQPLFDLWDKIQAFKSLDTSDDPTRFRLIAEITGLFPPEEQTHLKTARYLRRIRISHAASFSLHLGNDPTGFRFDPVLFGRKVRDRWSASGNSSAVSEAESLLPEEMQRVFAFERFPKWEECRDRYALRDGYYVYIEPALRGALTVVRKAQSAEPDTRRRFARSPQAYLKEELGDMLQESAIEQLFIPTEQYSERVQDLGVWQPVVLPWLVKEPNQWLPERFGIMVGDTRIDLAPQEAVTLEEKLREAVSLGKPNVDFRDQTIPATKEALDAMERLIKVAYPEKPAPPEISEDTLEEPQQPLQKSNSGPTFLIVDENYEDLTFTRRCKPRQSPGEELPIAIRSTLKPHQEEGLAWMQNAWRSGLPGVLLADDMGLGKTLSALCFLSWVRESSLTGERERRPFLIVAPTGLLKNWEAEHDLHLHSPGLGELLRVYGREVRQVRSSAKRSGRDTQLGEPQLDAQRLRSADWVLTTYETLRDYHLSFAAVPFAVAVYDEMQKVKNPASQLARAAKVINADFTLGLTGTPIENRIEDLWAIFDIVNPGYLKDLKSFSTSYAEHDTEALKKLKDKLMVPGQELPARMYRRMKSDHLPGLPLKKIVEVPTTMPPKQAEEYVKALAGANRDNGRTLLVTLQNLRSISLHPVHPQQWTIYGDDYISWSARLSQTFHILDLIAKCREKCLIFLESLEMQEVLALMIQRRYHLPRLPLVINGSVAGPKRQQAVDEFQSRRGEFEVMILSPKAGGVGLTLTAANHVIHLSRWWNPAVEDQCTDRIYRIGQNRDVHVYYPMAVHPDPGISESSFDLKLNDLLNRKRSLSLDVLIPPESSEDASALYDEIFKDSPQNNNTGLDDSLPPLELEDLDRMNPIQFENWVLTKLASYGFNARSTPATGDAGADGIVVQRSTGLHMIIQCKHRQGGKCDDSAIDDLLRARTRYDRADGSLVAFSNARFSRKANNRAKFYGIKLIGREMINDRWQIS
ncbi:MAG: SNF2-related protein [Syntrophobacteraceae bacterium]